LDQGVFDWILGERQAPTAPLAFHARFGFAGVELLVTSDDEELFAHVAETLGPGVPDGGRSALRARVSTVGQTHGFGCVAFDIGGAPVQFEESFLLGLTAREPVFERLDSPGADWTLLAFRGETEPVIAVRGSDCLFRLADGWRQAVALLAFHLIMLARKDAIFFHAASVAVNGRGALFIGPRGSGKSTLALALAARGHSMLGDDVACYLPASGDLLPCRRAVGIRPGPRAAAVDHALARQGRNPEREGPIRIEAATLLADTPPTATPLTALVFLNDFEPRPALTAIAPSREELAQLQPMVDSLVNATRAQRVFQLARLLAVVRIYRLGAGDPDATAAVLEEALGGA
jgi:hypothetical protein